MKNDCRNITRFRETIRGWEEKKSRETTIVLNCKFVTQVHIYIYVYTACINYSILFIFIVFLTTLLCFVKEGVNGEKQTFRKKSFHVFLFLFFACAKSLHGTPRRSHFATVTVTVFVQTLTFFPGFLVFTLPRSACKVNIVFLNCL